MAKKIYRVMAHCDYRSGSRSYCVGEFNTKREAKECLARQYTTVSRTFTIEKDSDYDG